MLARPIATGPRQVAGLLLAAVAGCESRWPDGRMVSICTMIEAKSEQASALVQVGPARQQAIARLD